MWLGNSHSPGSNGSHRSGLITCVRLGAVFKVRVWAPRAVDTDVPSCRDVWATVRLGHDRHHRDARGSAYRLGLQLGQKASSEFFRHCCDDFHKFGCLWHLQRGKLIHEAQTTSNGKSTLNMSQVCNNCARTHLSNTCL
jgi:hypothetical protein